MFICLFDYKIKDIASLYVNIPTKVPRPTVSPVIHQFSLVAQSCPTLCDPMDCSRPGLPVHHQAPRACSDSCPSSQWYHLTISSCCPLLLLPSIFPNIRVFSNKSVPLIRWPKCWSFSFSISPSNEYSGLISFRMDWLQSKGLSRIFSNTTVQKHQFFNSLVLSFLYSPTLRSIYDSWKNHSLE